MHDKVSKLRWSKVRKTRRTGVLQGPEILDGGLPVRLRHCYNQAVVKCVEQLDAKLWMSSSRNSLADKIQTWCYAKWSRSLARTQYLECDENPLLQQELQALRGIRWPWNKGLRALARIRELYRGYGPQAGSKIDLRAPEQRRQLRTQQLRLGHANPASEKQEHDQTPNNRWRDHDSVRVGTAWKYQLLFVAKKIAVRLASEGCSFSSSSEISPCKSGSLTIVAFLVLSSSLISMAQVRIPGPGGSSTVSAVGTFTLVQSFPTAVGCSGSTTCSMALTSSLGTGNLVTIQCYTANAVAIQSVNVGGTIVPIYSVATGNTNSFFPTVGYIVSSASTAGPIVVTFASAMGAGSTCYGREDSLSAGTPKLDWAHGTLKAGTTTCTGETVSTLSGSNDYIVQSNNTDYSLQVSGSASPYVNYKVDATNGPAWANRLNSISSTAPSWTGLTGSGNCATTGAAFATDATACNDEAFIDFSGGTNTNTVTVTPLTNSTFGYPTTGANNGWDVTASAAGITFATGAAFGSLHTNRRLCGTGATVTGTSTLGVQYDMSNAAKALARFGFNGSGTKASAGFFYKTGLTTQTNEDQIGFLPTGVNASVGIQFHNGTVQLECFGGSVTTTTVATISSNTWYWVTFQIDTGVGGAATVYETSTWTSVGSNTCGAGGWTATAPNRFVIGRFGGSSDTPAVNSLFSNIFIDASGAYPLLP